MQGTNVSDVTCQGGIARPYITIIFHKHHKVRSSVPAPSHPTPTLSPPSKMAVFGPSPSPSPSPLNPTLIILGGVIAGLSKIIYNISNNRILAEGERRSARAKEMKVVMWRLARFDAKIKSGEVMGREEMEEGKRMERLFRCWLCSLEDDAAADHKGTSLVVTFEKCRGWFRGGERGRRVVVDLAE